MALSKEENDMLTQVGPGKPAGEMLRRYWQPIGFANELQGNSKKRLLSPSCRPLLPNSSFRSAAKHAVEELCWL
jgi:hypothetical protein